MTTKFELPSGRVVDIENIIYLGEIRETTNFFDDQFYRFEVVWAGREKIEFTYTNKEKCVLDWEYMKRNILQHTTSI
jgi:hypothetical protein